MRIVHFSDIHVGRWPRGAAALLDKRLLGALNFFCRRRPMVRPEFLPRALQLIKTLTPDWVVCTGDLTSVGSPEEFRAALEQLTPWPGKGCGRLLFVPGNHDAYVPDPDCRAALERAVRELNSSDFGLSDLPREVRAGPLRFLLIDGCHPTNVFLSCGRLPDPACDRLAAWLAQPRDPGEKRILVGHFPLWNQHGGPLPWRRRLHNAAVLAEALAEGRLDLSLCGHVHQPFLRRTGEHGLEVCAGSLTLFGKLNVIDFSVQTGRFTQFWADVSPDEHAPMLIGKELSPVTVAK